MKYKLICITFLSFIFNSGLLPFDVNYFIKSKPMIIVIDAGHGGHDPGAVGKVYKEKDLALKIALATGKRMELIYPNVKVLYTRSTDVFLPLYKRADIANKAKADLFISIHCNFGLNPQTHGTETFILGTERASENLNVVQRENDVILLESDYKSNYEEYDPNSPEGFILLSTFQNIHLKQSLELGAALEKAMQQETNCFSRGVKQAGFAVLRRTSMPSLLFEAGFLSNADEEQRLGTAQGQEAIARAITVAFKDFISDYSKPSTSNSGSNPKEKTMVEDQVQDPSNANIASDLPHFKIQIAALTKSADLKSFKKMTQVGKLSVIAKDGLYKYYIGHYRDLTQAKLGLAKLKQLGCNSGFIVEF